MREMKRLSNCDTSLFPRHRILAASSMESAMREAFP